MEMEPYKEESSAYESYGMDRCQNKCFRTSSDCSSKEAAVNLYESNGDSNV